ncbi:MAG TPA: hypothetical protein VKW04_22470 [Planctomycetota bacterium]|nr:hypothetical protein [Planctomycetota bacterium]
MSAYPKNLEVRGGYFSSGIWTRRAAGLLRGKMLSYGDLSLPEELASRFAEWVKRHDLHGRKEGFDVFTFDAMGRGLANDLQRLVGPSCHVHYAGVFPSPSLLGRIVARFRP